VGQPHQWALDEQKRLIKEKAEAAKDGWNRMGTYWTPGIGLEDQSGF